MQYLKLSSVSHDNVHCVKRSSFWMGRTGRIFSSDKMAAKYKVMWCRTYIWHSGSFNIQVRMQYLKLSSGSHD